MSNLVIVMALLRGLHLAAMLSLLGTSGFMAWMLPATAAPTSLRRSLRRLGWASWLLALLAGAAWLDLQAEAMADAANLSELLDALPTVAMQTRYGNLMLIRAALLLVAALPLFMIGRCGRDVAPLSRQAGVYLVLVLSAAALGLQGFIGHAGATAGSIGDGLVLSEALHLLAAGLWLGALIPLWLSLNALPPEQSALVCERFSPIGLGCVVVLAGTGIVQALQLVGSVPGLLGTAYGKVTLVKTGLFLGALTLAALNRLWLTDRLTSRAARARRDLAASIAIETLLGLAIVGAAGFLASTMPAVHSTVVWPLSWQFSLVAVNDDPDLRREVIVSALLICGGAMLLGVALLWRRFRLPALAILAAILLQRAPSFALLTLDAYPTSFQTSATGFTAQSITHGQAVFAENCVVCHGPEADGNGSAAASSHIAAANLTTPHIMAHPDGELFWWLTHGIDAADGGLAMPGFGDSLSEDERWSLIDYIRAHYAGAAMQRDPSSDVVVRAPGFPLACNGTTASSTADLLGRPIHVVVGGKIAAASSVPPETVTLVIPAEDTAPVQTESVQTTLAPGVCVATESSAWNTFAVLANLPPDKVVGAEFLIDPNGWLRAVRPPARDWPSGENLLAAIEDIRAHPIERTAGGQFGSHH